MYAMHQTRIRRAAGFILFIWFCLQEPTPCRGQDYQLISTRLQGNNINVLQLSCRVVIGSASLQDAMFWLNSTVTDRELDNIAELQPMRISDSLSIRINKNYEGRYLCGPNENTVSTGVLIVAYPDPTSIVIPPAEPEKVVAGNTATLNPLVCPGKLIQQYFIDWKRNGTSETIAKIQGPRPNPSIFNPDPRYSVDRDIFSLTIQSVSFQDRGVYLGVVGVADPEGQEMEDTRTARQGVTLEVYVPPAFIESPQDQIISLMTDSAVTFSCIVEGYPKPTITWQHNDEDVSTSDKYILYEMSTSSFETELFVVNSTLMLLNPDNLASGTVKCIAVVLMDRESLVGSAEADLSVLGQVKDVTPFISIVQSDRVVYTVELYKQIPAEVQFYLQYTNLEGQSGITYNTTILNRFSQATTIRFEDTVNYRQFQIAVALVSGLTIGPLKGSEIIYDISKPSELNVLLVMYLVPTAGGILISVIVVAVLCVVFCRGPCSLCCLRCLPRSAARSAIENYIKNDTHRINCGCCSKQNTEANSIELTLSEPSSDPPPDKPSSDPPPGEPSSDHNPPPGVQCGCPPPTTLPKKLKSIFFLQFHFKDNKQDRLYFENLRPRA